MDRLHAEFGEPRLSVDEERERRCFLRLKHQPVKLGPRQREITHRAIVEVCDHRGWPLHALNVRTNHVHVVVAANRRGKRVYNDFKSYATRRMKEASAVPQACQENAGGDRSDQGAQSPRTEEPEFKVWTRGGSARVINDEASFQRAVWYTLHEQGPDITHVQRKALGKGGVVSDPGGRGRGRTRGRGTEGRCRGGRGTSSTRKRRW